MRNYRIFNVHAYPLVSDQVSYDEVAIIIQHLHDTLNKNIAGDIVEFGCYTGTTSLFIARLLKLLNEQRAFHVYDSFEGLPPKTVHDNSVAGDQFKAGELKAPKTQFIKNFRQAGLALPVIHKGWFGDLTEHDIPTQIAFAYLDGDFYESIHDCLRLIESRLSPGATIIVDDYQSESLPGAAKAVDAWLRGKNCHMQPIKSLAVIQCILSI